MARTREQAGGALERLRARIAGFRGYLGRDERRDTDQLLRDHGAAHLERVVRDLNERIAKAAADERGEHQELMTEVEKLRAELGFADRSYSAFFDETRLEANAALDALYAQDERIVEQVDEITAQVADAEFSVAKVRGSVKRLRFALADRRNAILRV